MANHLTLYHYWRSSSSWRVRFALAHKSVPCTYVPVSLLDGSAEAPEHQARDPMSHVPVLELADGTRLTESLAIIEWLEDTYPSQGEPLLPKDPLSRARVRQLAEIINSGVQPILNLDVVDALTERFNATPQAKKQWSTDFMNKGLRAFETWVTESGQGYSVGNTLTLADLCLIPQLYNARRIDLNLSAYPRLLEIEKKCMMLKAYTDSHPDRFEPKA